MIKNIVIATGFLAALGLGQPAHAYLDPGTGSILIQVLLGGAAGGAAILKLYWHNIRGYFSRGAAEVPDAGDAPQGDGEKSTHAKP